MQKIKMFCVYLALRPCLVFLVFTSEHDAVCRSVTLNAALTLYKFPQCNYISLSDSGAEFNVMLKVKIMQLGFPYGFLYLHISKITLDWLLMNFFFFIAEL